jgi:hypothetical protein
MKSVGEILIVKPNFIAAEGERNKIPSIGSILKTSAAQAGYLLVSDQFIESRIPGRTPAPYGLDYANIDEEQPQSNFLLRWMFQVTPVCSNYDGNLESFDKVPDIHSLLYELSDADADKILSNPIFIDFLFRIDEALLPQRNEVLMKLFRKYIAAVPSLKREDETLRILSRIAVILRNDYATLKKFARNLEVTL